MFLYVFHVNLSLTWFPIFIICVVGIIFSNHYAYMTSMSDSNNKELPPPLYHQRQSLMLCAVHAINNVLQRDAVTKADLNRICGDLAPGCPPFMNPHRNAFGLGNFDANALIVALQETGHDIVWFDKRTSFADHRLDWSKIVGCILNTRRKSFASVGGRHWVAFRGVPTPNPKVVNYYDFDSKLRRPALVARSHAEFSHYIERRLKELPDSQLLFVVPKEVLSERTWRLAEPEVSQAFSSSQTSSTVVIEKRLVAEKCPSPKPLTKTSWSTLPSVDVVLLICTYALLFILLFLKKICKGI